MSPLPPEVEANFATNPRSYQAWLAMRPVEWEVAAVRLMIKLCRNFRVPCISCICLRPAIADIRQAKEDGLPFMVETCPHYLIFAAEEIPDGDARFKCAPPMRGTVSVNNFARPSERATSTRSALIIRPPLPN